LPVPSAKVRVKTPLISCHPCPPAVFVVDGELLQLGCRVRHVRIAMAPGL
jgi:hypothetical protein